MFGKESLRAMNKITLLGEDRVAGTRENTVKEAGGEEMVGSGSSEGAGTLGETQNGNFCHLINAKILQKKEPKFFFYFLFDGILIAYFETWETG